MKCFKNIIITDDGKNIYFVFVSEYQIVNLKEYFFCSEKQLVSLHVYHSTIKVNLN